MPFAFIHLKASSPADSSFLPYPPQCASATTVRERNAYPDLVRGVIGDNG
jgi:hypothetical protein